MVNERNRIPEHLRPRNKGTDQIFKNRWLEIFTRTHISVPVTIHLIVCVGVSYVALQQLNILLFVLLFGAGWLFWTFSEYWIHRYVYHVKTDNKLLLKNQHAGHGIHHQYPKDPTRLAMPPLPAIILVIAFYGLFRLIMGDYALAFLPGFLFGYVLYISLHMLNIGIKHQNSVRLIGCGSTTCSIIIDILKVKSLECLPFCGIRFSIRCHPKRGKKWWNEFQ